MPQTYQNLNLWKNAMNFTLLIFKASQQFPKTEELSLTHQIKKSAGNIPINIAEGVSRLSGKESLKFINQAISSFREVDNYLTLAKELSFFNDDQFKFLQKQTENFAVQIGTFKQTLSNKMLIK